MSGGVLYVPLRDSSGLRSVSLNERQFVLGQCSGSGGDNDGLRCDGRDAGETRPVRMQLNRQFCQSECSVSLGASTKVSCSVRCELVPPSSPVSRPNEGMWIFRVDLSPMACLGWEYMTPSTSGSGGADGGGSGSTMGLAGEESQRWWSNRILRTLERTLVNGGAVDAEALCVQSGRWVWRLHVEVVVLDAGGNLVDASVLAAVSALRHFRAPAVDVMPNNQPPKLWHPSEREPTPLPIHHSPLCTSFALFRNNTNSVAALVDPSWREEMIMDGFVTSAFNQHGEMCGLDFAGGCELKPSQLTGCVQLAKQKCIDLCQQMETALEQAQQQAQQQLLTQLQLQQQKATPPLPPPPPLNPNIPFLQTSQNDNDDNFDMDQITDAAAKLAAQQEEQYRLQALEYSQLHQAAKVQENKRTTNKNNNNSNNNNNSKANNSLMAAMLQSASSIDNENTMNTSVQKDNNIAPSSTSNVQRKDDSQTKKSDNTNNNIIQENTAAPVVVPKSSKTNNKKKKVVLQQQSIPTHQMDDSDDEEVTTTLQSEFQSIQQPTTAKKTSSANVQTSDPDDNDIVMKTEDEDDVDDLAMAVKKKKKSKKSKKSKK